MEELNVNPWSNVGVSVNKSDNINQWLKQTGLDFTAKRSKVTFAVSDSEIAVGTSDVLWRSDTKKTTWHCNVSI